MKRIISAALALLLMLGCATAALALGAPYSEGLLLYVSGIDLREWSDANDFTQDGYACVDHTVEVYDCTRLWLDRNRDRDAVVRAIRAALWDRDLSETARDDGAWVYTRGDSVFLLWSEAATRALYPEDAIVVLEHYRVVKDETIIPTNPESDAWVYLSGIEGIRFVRRDLASDEIADGYYKTRQSWETFDCTAPMGTYGYAGLARLVGQSFLNAGFAETEDAKGYRCFRKATEEFRIWSEAASRELAGENGMMVISHAALTDLDPALTAYFTDAAEAAAYLGGMKLLRGVGTLPDGSTDYDLDRAPTRAEAVTLFVRLLGREEEALAGTWETPFTDVPDWAAPYVGYAYANKLTYGIDATNFGSDRKVTAAQYLTFVLRALGYSAETDFDWERAWLLTDELGLTRGEYSGGGALTRGQAAMISANALAGKLKGSKTSLLDLLSGKI